MATEADRPTTWLEMETDRIEELARNLAVYASDPEKLREAVFMLETLKNRVATVGGLLDHALYKKKAAAIAAKNEGQPYPSPLRSPDL